MRDPLLPSERGTQSGCLGSLSWTYGACPGAVGETEAILQKEAETEMKVGGESMLISCSWLFFLLP